MKVTTVKAYRGGSVVTNLTGLQATIFTDNTDMQALDGGAADYDSFTILLPWANPDIHRGDILQDEANGVDNYEVTNRPEQFPNGGCKVKAIQKVGT